MKKLLLLLLFVSIKVTAQDLPGTWKVTSYEDEIVYYNKSTDSISYKDPNRKGEAENFRKMYEMLILPITYNFKENNEFEMIHPILAQIKGTYEIDKKNNQLILSDKNSKSDTLPFHFNDETLYLRMELEEGFVKVGLEK